MPKVTVHQNQTPTEQIIERSRSKLPSTIKDKLGRVITIKMPTLVDEFDLNKAVGKETLNETCQNMITALLFVAAIDGEPLLMPQSFSEIRAAFVRLQREGMNAVLEAVENMQKTQQEEIEEIKK